MGSTIANENVILNHKTKSGEVHGMVRGFGELIRMKREALGLTTAELAERAGVPESIIVAIENGSFLPPSFFLPVLINALGGDETGEIRAAYQSEAMRCFSFG